MTKHPSAGRAAAFRLRLIAQAALAVMLATLPLSVKADGFFGGIEGVTVNSGSFADPAGNGRSFQAVPNDAITAPPQTLIPFVGDLRVWMDRADNTYQLGDRARIFVSPDQGAYVQVLTVGPQGTPVDWLYPPQGINGQVFPPRYVAARQTLELPNPRDGIHYEAARPTGTSLIYVIASSAPLPDDSYGRLTIELRAAGEAGGVTAVRNELDRLARSNPNWRMRVFPYLYDVVERGFRPAPGAAGPLVPVPAPPPSAPPALQSQTGPVMSWARPLPRGSDLSLSLDRRAYHTGDTVTVTVSSGKPCSLLVLGLGSGGLIDVLYPNILQRGDLASGPEMVVPRRGSTLQLRMRGAEGSAPVEERVVALCLPPGSPSYAPAGNTRNVPTLSFLPRSPEAAALEGLFPLLAQLRLVEQRYVVGPASETTH